MEDPGLIHAEMVRAAICAASYDRRVFRYQSAATPQNAIPKTMPAQPNQRGRAMRSAIPMAAQAKPMMR